MVSGRQVLERGFIQLLALRKSLFLVLTHDESCVKPGLMDLCASGDAHV